jgi:hypothetical protein
MLLVIIAYNFVKIFIATRIEWMVVFSVIIVKIK